MNLSTKILIGLALGIIAGLELGAEGAGFAKTWIGPLGTIFMNMIKKALFSILSISFAHSSVFFQFYSLIFPFLMRLRKGAWNFPMSRIFGAPERA